MQSNRDLHEYIRKTGARASDLSLPQSGILQPVEIVADSRWLSKPLLRSRFMGGGRTTAAAAKNPITYLTAGSDGLILETISTSTAGFSFGALQILTTAQVLALGGYALNLVGAVVPIGEPLAVSTSVVTFASANPPNLSTLQPCFIFNNGLTIPFDWFIPSGLNVLIVQMGLDLAGVSDTSFVWTEAKGATTAP